MQYQYHGYTLDGPRFGGWDPVLHAYSGKEAQFLQVDLDSKRLYYLEKFGGLRLIQFLVPAPPPGLIWITPCTIDLEDFVHQDAIVELTTTLTKVSANIALLASTEDVGRDRPVNTSRYTDVPLREHMFIPIYISREFGAGTLYINRIVDDKTLHCEFFSCKGTSLKPGNCIFSYAALPGVHPFYDKWLEPTDPRRSCRIESGRILEIS
jgi:hypothetical protein